MRQEIVRVKINGIKQTICLIGAFLLLLGTEPLAFANCNPSELSAKGKKLWKEGVRYKKENTYYKACRINNGGLLWVLNLNHCEVTRIRERNSKNRLKRNLFRPEETTKRKKSEQLYKQMNPPLPSCESIHLP